ncbi:MAG TPA: hypothetical protein VG755_26580 [Nannocystaceae bacterium]|nr:hypothetical protein [Nannocystaceae bacterium]
MTRSVGLSFALLVGGCLAVPPVRAPHSAAPPSASTPVPIPQPSGARDATRLSECPLLEGKGQACGGGLGQVCTRDDKGCERCECKPSPGTEGQTVDPNDLDPRGF